MLSIKFRENFNNKLNCTYFTSIRDCEPSRFKVGAVYKVYIGNLFVKKAVLLKATLITLSQLDDVFLYMDSGCDRTQFMSVFQDFYPNFDLSSKAFYRLLFKTVL